MPQHTELGTTCQTELGWPVARTINGMGSEAKALRQILKENVSNLMERANLPPKAGRLRDKTGIGQGTAVAVLSGDEKPDVWLSTISKIAEVFEVKPPLRLLIKDMADSLGPGSTAPTKRDSLSAPAVEIALQFDALSHEGRAWVKSMITTMPDFLPAPHKAVASKKTRRRGKE